MPSDSSADGSRRDFLTGKAIRKQIEQTGDVLADEITAAENQSRELPSSGDTIRLATRAMACDFGVLLNPGPSSQITPASDALDLVHQLEAQMSVYRDDSELSQLNQRAAESEVEVEPRLFELLLEAKRLADATTGCFDPTSGPLVSLWRKCRDQNRIPTPEELSEALGHCGIDKITFDGERKTVRYQNRHIELNLGGIGKGYALDRAGAHLKESEIESWLIHGGHSSLLASGSHHGQEGWPVGIRNPLFPKERFATILIRDCGFSTSGSGVQYFRHGGKRYGHILDPRDGWPVDNLLSVTVLAPTAAEADALSTAFFVLGVEKTKEYCDNNPHVRALLIPPPHGGRTLEPVNCGIPDESVWYSEAGTPSKT